MNSILIAGYSGPLAERTAGILLQAGHSVREVPPSRSIGSIGRPGDYLLYVPFSPKYARRDRTRISDDLARQQQVLEEATALGLTRVVLRSHAVVYGSSWKNYGLLEESRIPLVSPDSPDYRWFLAEECLQQRVPGALWSWAVARLATLLDTGEGDFVTHTLRGPISVPLAGHDPRIQFLTLEDAAQALVRLLLSPAQGFFNVAGEDTVSYRDALKAAVRVRVPVGGALQKTVRNLLWTVGVSRFPGPSAEQICYNWTVSTERARRELGFAPRTGSRAALLEFVKARRSGRVEPVRPEYDDFGLDPEYLRRWAPWFSFLRRIYWRVESEGLENIPAAGAALFVSNHRGFMPFDGVVHRSLVYQRCGRHIRFLVIPSLFKFPFLSDFLIKQGGVVASQLNANRLFQKGEIVGVFPEGIQGAFRMFKGAYRLGTFGRDAFARLAIENQVPVIPAATIGHVEIFPILKRIDSSWITRLTGWPFLPITPTFPLLPLPLPTKWHVRYLPPIAASGTRPQDAGDRKVVREFSNHVRRILQEHIDEMLSRRKHWFFGSVFDPPSKALLTGKTAAGE